MIPKRVLISFNKERTPAVVFGSSAEVASSQSNTFGSVARLLQWQLSASAHGKLRRIRIPFYLPDQPAPEAPWLFPLPLLRHNRKFPTGSRHYSSAVSLHQQMELLENHGPCVCAALINSLSAKGGQLLRHSSHTLPAVGVQKVDAAKPSVLLPAPLSPDDSRNTSPFLISTLTPWSTSSSPALVRNRF